MMQVPVHPTIDHEFCTPGCKKREIKILVARRKAKSIIISWNGTSNKCPVIGINNTVGFALGTTYVFVFDITRFDIRCTELNGMCSHFSLCLKDALVNVSKMLSYFMPADCSCTTQVYWLFGAN